MSFSLQNSMLNHFLKKMCTWRFKVTLLGWLSDPFKGLSDLQLGDEKGTLNHLVYNNYAVYCTY